MSIKKSLVFMLVFCLVACASQPISKIPVTLSDNQLLDFTGKGAAAGIMLDSVMGGAGIAIGIAIDKGIAKDIANNLSHHKPLFNIVDSLDKQLKSAMAKNHLRGLQGAQIVIEHYGYKTYPGGGDAVSAWLEVNLIINGNKTHIRYPENFDHIESASLTSVKESPDVAYALLNGAAAQVVDRILSDVKQ